MHFEMMNYIFYSINLVGDTTTIIIINFLLTDQMNILSSK